MPSKDLDLRVRLAAFEFLAQAVSLHGEVLPARLLRRGFNFEGGLVKLKGVQGIFKPQILPDLPLSITTAPPEPGLPPPYADGFSQDQSTLLYRYRGTDPRHHQNVGLRRAMERGRPLVYFHGIDKSEYFAVWPVYVIGDEPHALRFRIAIDDSVFASQDLLTVAEGSEARREYVTHATRYRIHQKSFRARVLRAYQSRCALCRLRHHELLDAAHIVPDSDPLGIPEVPNGLALCKLHHAAFDQNLIGIRRDLVVQVRADILAEDDGPMLIHGLQEFHDHRILIPRRPDQRPRGEFLERRFEEFLAAPRP